MSLNQKSSVFQSAGGPDDLWPMSMGQTMVYVLFSVLILAAYLGMNIHLYPRYPVITDYAEQSRAYSAHYPPFRMNEWLTYAITDELIAGESSEPESLASNHPIGYPLTALPLVRQFGEIGMYYTSAFILWACALAFFHLVRMAAGFGMALVMTLVLAFASPNLFFAASAYGEPLSQFLLLCAAVVWFKARRLERFTRTFDMLCGLCCGLHVFIVPTLALSVCIPLVMALRSRDQLRERVQWLGMGFAGALAGFGIVSAIVLHRIPFGILTYNSYLNIFNMESMYYSGMNPVVSFLKLLFDSPHGILFVMPVVMLTPVGLLAMWRHGERMLAGGFAAIMLVILGLAIFCRCPVSGEVVGTRQLAPLIPFLLVPLAFIRYLGRGEQLWFVLAMLLTVYQSSFGWWLGTARGEGVFVGILNDRAGRYILLARKDMLDRPQYRSSQELREAFRRALATNDIRLWLTTLDHRTIDDIRGFERIVFARLVGEARAGTSRTSDYIASVDPDTGIRLELPGLLDSDVRFPVGVPAE